MKYGQELLTDLERELKELKARNDNRFNRVANGDVELSDCFVSSWAGRLNQQLLEAKIEILRNGGVAEFQELYYLDGTPTNATLVSTSYGIRFLVHHPDGFEEWVNPYTKEKTLARKGYRLATVIHPAWAKIKGSGYGLAGAMNCCVDVFPSRVNYWTGEPAEEVSA